MHKIQILIVLWASSFLFLKSGRILFISCCQTWSTHLQIQMHRNTLSMICYALILPSHKYGCHHYQFVLNCCQLVFVVFGWNTDLCLSESWILHRQWRHGENFIQGHQGCKICNGSKMWLTFVWGGGRWEQSLQLGSKYPHAPFHATTLYRFRKCRNCRGSPLFAECFLLWEC